MKTVPMLIGIMVLSGVPTWASPPPPVTRVEIREGHLIVNGGPFFPVGIGWAAHGHFSLPDAGEKGFNLVTTHAGDPRSFRFDIDDAYANGMYAMAHLGNGVWENLEQVERIVRACRDAPGLLVWELEDEPNIRNPGPKDAGKPHLDMPYRMPPERFKPVYDLIKRLDPVHPVMVNLAYGYLKDHQNYRDVADIQSDDVYPVPHAPLTHVAQCSESVVKGSAGKPGWMWIQMAPLQGGPKYIHEGGIPDRAPTMTEVRCMTYMAVAHGISGVNYFSFHFNASGGDWWVNQSEPAYWAQWADLTAELRCLAPYLLAPGVPGVAAEIIEGSKEPGNFGYTALHLSLRQIESGYFLIAVNGFNSPIKARLTVPVSGRGLASHAAVRSEHRLVEVKKGVLVDFFAPYDVHLYELPFSVDVVGSPVRETITWPRWQRRARP